MNELRPKDYVETLEGLLFAVVASGDMPVMSLRYVRSERGRLDKIDNVDAARMLEQAYPQYLRDSNELGMKVQTVDLNSIVRHFRADHRAVAIIEGPANNKDTLLRKASDLLQELVESGVSLDALGVTGSCLIDAHNEDSDIDLVVYNRRDFNRVREFVRVWNVGNPVSIDRWREAFEKRNCSMSYDEYCQHESRKHNKIWLDSTKVDFSLVATGDGPQFSELVGKKIEKVIVEATVVDDEFSFDHPSVWTIESSVASRLVSWTATYTGQTRVGERIQVSGWLESANDHELQIVVGSSREAQGEFIRVVDR